MDAKKLKEIIDTFLDVADASYGKSHPLIHAALSGVKWVVDATPLIDEVLSVLVKKGTV